MGTDKNYLIEPYIRNLKNPKMFPTNGSSWLFIKGESDETSRRDYKSEWSNKPFIQGEK